MQAILDYLEPPVSRIAGIIHKDGIPTGTDATPGYGVSNEHDSRSIQSIYELVMLLRIWGVGVGALVYWLVL